MDRKRNISKPPRTLRNPRPQRRTNRRTLLECRIVVKVLIETETDFFVLRII